MTVVNLGIYLGNGLCRYQLTCDFDESLPCRVGDQVEITPRLSSGVSDVSLRLYGGPAVVVTLRPLIASDEAHAGRLVEEVCKGTMWCEA